MLVVVRTYSTLRNLVLVPTYLLVAGTTTYNRILVRTRYVTIYELVVSKLAIKIRSQSSRVQSGYQIAHKLAGNE